MIETNGGRCEWAGCGAMLSEGIGLFWHHHLETDNHRQSVDRIGVKRSLAWNRRPENDILQKVYEAELAACTIYCRKHHGEVHARFNRRRKRFLKRQTRRTIETEALRLIDEEKMTETRAWKIAREKWRLEMCVRYKRTTVCVHGWVCVHTLIYTHVYPPHHPTPPPPHLPFCRLPDADMSLSDDSSVSMPSSSSLPVVDDRGGG